MSFGLRKPSFGGWESIIMGLESIANSLSLAKQNFEVWELITKMGINSLIWVLGDLFLCVVIESQGPIYSPGMHSLSLFSKTYFLSNCKKLALLSKTPFPTILTSNSNFSLNISSNYSFLPLNNLNLPLKSPLPFSLTSPLLSLGLERGGTKELILSLTFSFQG